jgi:hypothetical protein
MPTSTNSSQNKELAYRTTAVCSKGEVGKTKQESRSHVQYLNFIIQETQGSNLGEATGYLMGLLLSSILTPASFHTLRPRSALSGTGTVDKTLGKYKEHQSSR